MEEDTPVIAVQNYSLALPYSHARVITGYNDEKQEIISNDPTAGEDHIIAYSDFAALNTGSNPDLFKSNRNFTGRSRYHECRTH